MVTRRRVVIALGAGALASPFARAQSARRFRIGCLCAATEVIFRPYRVAFLAGMRERGYLMERNLMLEERYAEGNPGRYLALAEELIIGLDHIRRALISRGNGAFANMIPTVEAMRSLTHIRRQDGSVDSLQRYGFRSSFVLC